MFVSVCVCVGLGVRWCVCVLECNMFAAEMNGGALNKMLTESKLQNCQVPRLTKNIEI